MNLEETLRHHGCRVTQARRVVWEVLHTSRQHLNALQIAERVNQIDPAINLSSVYRVLELFTKLDIARESRLEDDAATWEAAHDDAVIHLRCDVCGVVHHFSTALVPTLQELIEDNAGFEPDSIDVRVRGRCDDCLPPEDSIDAA